MPRDRRTPQELAQVESANRRAAWLAEFGEELARLRPHLRAGASELLQQIGVAELRRGGVQSDPAAAARAYHQRG
jgi:hypothetical protein